MKQANGMGKKNLVIGVLIIMFLIVGIVLASIMVDTTRINNSNRGVSLENYDENEPEEPEESDEDKGKVIIKYKDEEGNKISDDEEVEGKIGTEYETTRKTIAHYKSNGEEPINKAGNFKETDIIVTYVYKLVSDSVDIKSQNNVITLQVENEIQNREYKLRLEQESTEGDKLTGGKFTLIDNKDDSELVKGTTTDGALTLGVINVKDEVNEEYDLSEDEAPKGYEKALKTGNFTMTLAKTYNATAKKYELSVTSEDTELELEEDAENDEIIVKVQNEKIKTYELAIKEYVSSIDDEETERSIEARVNNEGEIVYDETEEGVIVRDFEKVVYTIRVYNEGNQDMKAGTITQVLPAGLKFLEDSQINEDNGWTLSEGKLTTNKIANETIAGIDTSKQTEVQYEELQLEVEVVEDDADDGDELESTTSIQKDEREENQDNNECTETVTLSRIPATYDLAVKKFASKINGEDTGRSVTATLNNLNQIVYEENNADKTIKHEQNVVYTIRVYNEGNRELNGTTVTEILPEGLTLARNSEINETYGWTEENETISTDYLTTKTIERVRTYRGELPKYEEIQIELTLDEDDVEDGTTYIVNEVQIAKAENETDDLDNEDNDAIRLDRTPKTYDFTVKLFASEIAGHETSRNVTATVTEEKEIEYIENRPEKSAKDEEKIIYTIRIFNEGTGEITGTKLTDTIPAGLKLAENSEINEEYGWQPNGNNAETTYLEDKTIKGVNLRRNEVPKYTDVKIELEVVEDNTENEQTKLTNKVSIAKAEGETDETDNIDEDIVNLDRKPAPLEPEETFDVIMKKFVYSIDGKNLDKEIVAKNNEGQLVFENDNTKTTVSKGQTVVFTLRMFNIGDQPMNGNTVTDTIPQGLEYIEDSEINGQYNWTVENSIATTNYLEGQTIEGFDKENGEDPKYLEVKIECKVTGEGISAEESIINKAKMESSDDDQDKDNNEDETELVLEPEEQKVSDLSMKKFLFSVDGEELLKREIKAINKSGKIVYTSNKDVYEVSNNQKVVYTLRVYNVGDGETLGREVIEELPEGLEFIQNSTINKENGWKMYKKDKAGNLVAVEKVEDATVLKTNKLVTETIAGFKAENNETPRYKDVKIELLVNENKIKNADRIITNVAKVTKLRTEPDSNNDQSEESLKVKKFDLSITKYIKQIKIVDGDGERTTPVGLENRDKIIKKEVHKKKLDETELYVTYGLRVKNIGEIAGYATQITDYIPANFELVGPEYGWKVNENTVTTDILAKHIIEPGDYKTVEITFKWKLSDGELGVRNNKAIISEYKNDYNAKDNTQDKENETKFIVSIRTGEAEIIAMIILTILIVIAIVIAIKLRKQSEK